MAIALSIEHVDGVRLRQQMATNVQRVVSEKELSSGLVLGGTEWHFEKKPGTREDVELKLDLDPRTKKPLTTYSATINFGLKNLVIEKKGPIAQIVFRNSALRNQLRVKYQTLSAIGKKSRDGVDIQEWKDSGGPQYLAPQSWGGVAVADGTRAILDEMPT